MAMLCKKREPFNRLGNLKNGNMAVYDVFGWIESKGKENGPIFFLLIFHLSKNTVNTGMLP